MQVVKKSSENAMKAEVKIANLLDGAVEKGVSDEDCGKVPRPAFRQRPPDQVKHNK